MFRHKKEASPNSVLSPPFPGRRGGYGNGTGGNDSGGSAPGGGGNGGGDGGSDPGGSGPADFSKAIAAADPSTHRYWKLVFEHRLSYGSPKEAGEFIVKLMEMGLSGITGITEKVDTTNAESQSLAIKKSQQAYDKTTSGSLLSALQRTDAYKGPKELV